MIEVATKVDAGAAQLWEAVAEVTAWPNRLSTMRSLELVDDGPLQLGSVAEITQPLLGRLRWVVTAFEAGRSFTWEARRPGLVVIASHVVEGQDDGSSLLVLKIEQHGPLGRLLGWSTGVAVRKALRLEAASHRREAEARA